MSFVHSRPTRTGSPGDTAEADDAMSRRWTPDVTVDCPFCDPYLTSSHDPHDRVLAAGPGVILLPARGMLAPGHLLVATWDHVLGMSSLGPSILTDVHSWLDRMQHVLEELFGRYMLFEHGSSAEGSSGVCIDHAHIHMLPLADKMGRELVSDLPWAQLNEYGQLAEYAGTDYAYLAIDNHHYVLPSPRFPSQWIRQRVAGALGRDDWDWCLTQDARELERTLDRLAGHVFV
jgi:diadenosine tetraphosphate (Ap4A) HIT family hydrolase